MEHIKSRFTKASNIDNVGFLTRLVFGHVYSIFAKGYRNNGLEMDDLPGCSVDDEAEVLMSKVQKNWKVELSKNNASLAWALHHTSMKCYVITWTFYLFQELIFLAQPLMLGMLIRYFNGDPTIDQKSAFVYALGLLFSKAATVLVDYPCTEYMMRNGMRQRTACCALVYSKSLRLSQKALKETTTVGQMVNLMSNDAARLDEFSSVGSYLMIAPLQTCHIVCIVWTYLGVASLVGIFLLILFIPFQAKMGKLFSEIRNSTANLTDTRLRYMNEIISGMRVIKMYCWENPFAARIAESRKAEVSSIRRACFLKAINTSIFFVVSRLILFACFVVFVLLGNQLTAEAVFVSMALFNRLRVTMTLLFPVAVTVTSEFVASCKRIQEFLLLEEMPTPLENSHTKNNSASLDVNNISARWNVESKKPTLKDISLDLKPGDLLAVIGPVGSGKSSLLMSILKELPLESGQIDLHGSVSYSSQDAWLFNDGVRNNILFGTEYDYKLYQNVVKVCALERDLNLMPQGDRTLVGEKGVSLSGGQKARISLARAVYRDADICLLDDPLSAVDAPVAKHIFEKCIVEHLSSKIRILVTYQIQFIEKATKVLILNEGKCLAYGTFQETQQMGIDFVGLIQGQIKETRNKQGNKIFSEKKDKSKKTTNEKDEKSVQIEEEQHQRGSIKARIYWEYIGAGTGVMLFTSMIVFSGISQTLLHGSDIFLTYWTNKNQNDTQEQHLDVLIYTILIVALLVTTIVRAVTFFTICMRASVQLHNQLFNRLIRVPLAFFDSNPVGRIMSRFATDLGIVDEQMPFVAFDLNLNLIQTVGIIATVCLVNWCLVLPSIGLAIVIYYVRDIYLKSSLDIKRFQGLVQSPVYSHLSTTMDGLATVRAFGAQAQLERQFHLYLNDYTATDLLSISTSRLFGFVMEWICIVYIGIITVAVMLSENILGSDVGLVISSGLILSGMMQYGVRQSAEFESQMVSVERIVQYQTLEQEAPAVSRSAVKPTLEWPQFGAIEFHEMSLTYKENTVLKNINFTIRGGEKIGIVGRTGAGKSSIIAALFRLTEPSGGQIRIDGVDIQSIGLDDLRRKISIIPQDPVVFNESIRYNLDPLNEFSEKDLWAALEKVQLKTFVETFNEKLNEILFEGGSNLSVGQRQLICLARAILRRNQILILDEATANVDHQTDSFIQKTIRSEFSTCTVITIAHRLHTIIDSDRVLVLDDGVIVEFDSTYKLLQNKNGAFHKMCQDTGDAMFEHLSQLSTETQSVNKSIK